MNIQLRNILESEMSVPYTRETGERSRCFSSSECPDDDDDDKIITKYCILFGYILSYMWAR